VLNDNDRAKFPELKSVSIPLLSGPVLNDSETLSRSPARRLNPFAFRASAEHSLTRNFGPQFARLNPFAFRASAELLRRAASSPS